MTPSVQPAAGVTVKAIAGEVDDGRGGSVRGPIAQPATDPLYLDVALDAGAVWEYALPEGHNAFAYVFEGGATIGEGDDARTLATHEMGVLGGGDTLRLQAGKDRSEEHTSELQSLIRISYAVFCLKQQNNIFYTYSYNYY